MSTRLALTASCRRSDHKHTHKTAIPPSPSVPGDSGEPPNWQVADGPNPVAITNLTIVPPWSGPRCGVIDKTNEVLRGHTTCARVAQRDERTHAYISGRAATGVVTMQRWH